MESKNYPERKEMIRRLNEVGVKATTKLSTLQLESKWDKNRSALVSHARAVAKVEEWQKSRKKAENKARRQRLRKLRKRRGW